MNYKSVANLNYDILNWIPDLPRDIELVIGIPRSGLLAANILALHLNLPFTDLDGYIAGRIFVSGQRDVAIDFSFDSTSKVLVIDDSVCSGTQMQIAKTKLNNLKKSCEIIYSAVYIANIEENHVDYWYKKVDLPRVFEWNLFHRPIIKNSCIDIDGVLCRDPSSQENDDGPKYLNFIKNVKPNIIPTVQIGWLVTCRLEKYRTETEEWLNKHGIRYDKLIMMNVPDKKTRIKLGNHSHFKATIYNKLDARLFIESSAKQANEMIQITGKPVFCYEKNEMIQPKNILKNAYRLKRKSKRIKNNIYRSIKNHLSILFKN